MFASERCVQSHSVVRCGRPTKLVRRVGKVSLLLGLAASLAGCSKELDEKEFQARVRQYLIKNPEVIRDAVDALAKKQEKAELDKAAHAISSLKGDLEASPGDAVINPTGSVTVVEFMDVQCPHCKTSRIKLEELTKRNPQVRVVVKMLPVFGDLSDRSYALISAAARAGKDPRPVIDSLMTDNAPLSRQKLEQVAQSHGIPFFRTNGDITAQDKAGIAKVKELAQKIGVTGTPAFIVGKRMIQGSDIADLVAAISEEGHKVSL